MAVSGTGAAGGAASGAAMGSMIAPGWGTAIGAGLGGLMGSGLLGGGGGETQQVKLPGYAQDLSKEIGYGTLAVLKQQKDANLIGETQQRALTDMLGTAYNGSGLGNVPKEYLQQLFGGTGLSQQAEGLGNDILAGNWENQAQGTVNDIASGGQVGTNPYLDDTFNRAAQAVTKNYREAISPGMTSNAAMSGRLGSGTYARMRNNAESAVGDQMTSLANQVYGGAYEQDRNRQMQALQQQGQLSQQDVANHMQAANLFDAGLGRQMQGMGMIPGAVEAQYMDAQKMLDVEDTFRDLQFRPFARANAAFAGTPMEKSSVSSIQTNPLKDVLGMGIGLYSAFKPDTPAGQYDPRTGQRIG